MPKQSIKLSLRESVLSCLGFFALVIVCIYSRKELEGLFKYSYCPHANENCIRHILYKNQQDSPQKSWFQTKH